MLFHGLEGRQTIDIDVLRASPQLSALQGKIERVAQKHRCQDNWINDDVKRAEHFLPSDYESRLLELEEDFGNLHCKGISKVDLVLSKLSVDTIRPRDIEDVEGLHLTSRERMQVEECIADVGELDRDRGSEMLRRFRLLSISGTSATPPPSREQIETASDLFRYAEEVRGIKLDSQVKSMMREDLASGERKIEDLVILVDGIAYEAQHKGKKSKRGMPDGLDI